MSDLDDVEEGFDMLRGDNDLRQQLTEQTERADALNVAYDILRDNVVFGLEKRNVRLVALLREALRAYAWHTESCVFQDCTCGFETWRAAVVQELAIPNSEELPFSEPPHD